MVITNLDLNPQKHSEEYFSKTSESLLLNRLKAKTKVWHFTYEKKTLWSNTMQLIKLMTLGKTRTLPQILRRS